MTKVKSENDGLFVAEEEEEEEVHSETGSPEVFEDAGDRENQDEEQEDEQEEDPVVSSIPLVLNGLSSRNRQSLHILQYLGRPKSRPFGNESLTASVKKESNCIEVKVPLDTLKFYDRARSEEWGGDVEEHGLQGVLNKTDGGLYAAKIIKEGNQRKIILIPVDSTAQLRPSFKYMDEVDAASLVQRKAEAASDTKPTGVQVLQTSAKANANVNADGVAHNALGEALKHIKKFDEEEWSPLNWRLTDDSATENLHKELIEQAEAKELTTKTTMFEYIDKLTAD